MITLLIHFLIAALVGFIIYYVVTLFVADGRIQKVVGLIIGLIVLLYGLKLFAPSIL